MPAVFGRLWIGEAHVRSLVSHGKPNQLGSNPAPVPMSQPESRLQRRIRKALEREFPGSFWWKVHGGAYTRAGIPDLCGCVRGRHIALEVKRPDGTVSAIQRSTHRRLKRAGAAVAVVATPAEAIDVVHLALKRPRVRA